MPPHYNVIIHADIEKMLLAGIIKPANSTWFFYVVIVTEKDRTCRFCVDYDSHNQRIKSSGWPILHIEELFDELKCSRVLSTLDLLQGYWRVKMAEACEAHSTFVLGIGTLPFNFMPFGFSNGPDTFPKMMDEVLKDLCFARATFMT